jgi:hypothetical protein
VCEAYGVELFAKSAPLDPDHREVLVRTQADRGARHDPRVDTMDKLERTLRSWGLRPLDARTRTAWRQAAAPGPTATSEWDVYRRRPPALMDEIEIEAAMPETSAADWAWSRGLWSRPSPGR